MSEKSYRGSPIVALRLKKEMKERLDKFVEDTNDTPTEIIRYLLDKFLTEKGY
ncbi:hypothetical protein NIES2100_35290 [Calothrix sp. NIES-2100]|uniref:hypothetical protein n=1 Tax=Calothrix sp. NIES-2100 TaxID=1954172 RepID=UPI000B61B09F|nr:hypothetical protein NIES2100_35290 [Calothrix sp. NIES-2100]